MLFDDNTRSSAIDEAYPFIHRTLPALEKAAEHPDTTEELAEVLTTPTVDVVGPQAETSTSIR